MGGSSGHRVAIPTHCVCEVCWIPARFAGDILGLAGVLITFSCACSTVTARPASR